MGFCENARKKTWIEKGSFVFFLLQIFLGVFLSFWLLFEHQPKTGDDVEHLHSAWLVLQGKIPYIDFFQHHNPLLWYIFAPLMKVFAYDLAVFDMVRIISTIFMLLTIFVSSLIAKRFMTGSWGASLLGVVAVFPSYVIYSGNDFRPDNYMIFSFVVGLYYFFCYLDEKKVNSLVKSFAFFIISFFFMQKIVFTLCVVGGVCIYLLVKKEIKLNDFLKAIIIPLICLIIFASWLLYHDMLERYWLSNYIFNLYIPDVYSGLVETTKSEFYVVSAIAFLGCVYYLILGNTIQRIVCLLWVAEALQRFFYFSLDRHYYYQLQIQNIMLAGPILYLVVKKCKYALIGLIALSSLGCWEFLQYCSALKLDPSYHRYVTPKYVLEQTNRCDVVLNGYGVTYGIFSKDATYYWNLNGQLDVIGSKIGIEPLHDLDKTIREHLPRIIYTGPYWDEKLKKQNKSVVVHFVSDYLKNKYYRQSLFVDVFILKDEYQNKRRCRYDVETKSWNYFYTR
ncbi:MAG: glycosyltransferase family 39 protein [Alphaproteobacteria bacterium]|nr:glycosyltransferase family 39 protein [Alphaproteobacteria bacterium]